MVGAARARGPAELLNKTVGGSQMLESAECARVPQNSVKYRFFRVRIMG